LEILDLNAEIYFKNKKGLSGILSNMDGKKILSDGLNVYPFYSKISENIEAEYENIKWGDYEAVFITTPSWFVTIPTEAILEMTNVIQRECSRSKIYFFGNSVGTWTDEAKLKYNNIKIVHLNNLLKMNPIKEPVDYDLLPTPIYKNRDRYVFKILPFRLKHGCIWGKCRFCSLAKGWNSGYLERSAKSVIRELEQVIDNYSPKMLVCRDNSLNGNNLLEFCDYFRSFTKPWVGMSRADLSKREIEALQRAGCRSIYFGLESGSDRVLNEINKGINSRQMSVFLRSLHVQGIKPAPSLVVGTPGETEDDFETTIQFILDHKDYFDILNLHPFTISPASEYSLMNTGMSSNTLARIIRLIKVCEDIDVKVCVGEQSAEYVLFKNSFPDLTIYSMD